MLRNMSDKKKSKRRKEEYTGPGGNQDSESPSPTKDEIKVAKWMKKNIPTKKTKFLSHNVEYFSASKAIDALLDTQFAKGDNALFQTREDVIQYLDGMLVHKFFHRAKKVPVSEAELRRGKKQRDPPIDKETPTEDKPRDLCDSELRKRKTADVDGEQQSSDVNRSPKSIASPADEQKLEKKKRKIRLDMHPDQQFVDGAEAYIWIYDPIPMHYWLFGALLVIGAIVVCLFPLWPPTLRLGVYYLSVASAGFLVFIIGLAVIRFILFCIIWVLTGSRHHFWLFPHLTDDVGFFASFWPIYEHTYVSGKSEAGHKERVKSHISRKDKNSDVEDSSVRNSTHILSTTPSTKTIDAGATDLDDYCNRRKSRSDSESECSQKSSTGKDFEIVNSEEVDLS